MSAFRTGSFDRKVLSGLIRPFCPHHAVHSLKDVDLQGIANRGKKLILLDVDNTLVKWRTEEFAQETLDWIAEAKRLNFQVCIISNTRNQERLGRLSQMLDIPTMRGRFKPSRAMFHAALDRFGVRDSEAIMIGDQLFTDIWGGNRAGIETVLLQPISSVEFGPTKISRFGERMIKGFLYGALTEPIDAEPESPQEATSKPFWERRIVRQFVKFCIVGGTSFVIDYCIRMTLLFAFPYQGEQLSAVAGRWLQSSLPAVFSFAETPRDAFFPIAALIAASVAILNSFYWNRMWTFKIRSKDERAAQLRRFFAISLIGLAFNVLLSSFFNHIVPADPKNAARIATVLAAAIVAIWNFTGQRLYAFRPLKK